MYTSGVRVVGRDWMRGVRCVELHVGTKRHKGGAVGVGLLGHNASSTKLHSDQHRD